MGLLVDGIWQDDDQAVRTQNGHFVRPVTRYRNWITPGGEPGSSGNGGFAAALGRYHLYVALACPWAHRTVIMRMLKGLEDVVSMSVVEPLYGPRGWKFGTMPGATPDTANGKSELAEIYLLADPRFTGRVTVPVLWDKEARVIVNNSEDDICRMFNGVFSRFGDTTVELFPGDIAEEQNELSAFIYENVNNGVYKAGFATTQRSYEKAARALFAALDELEARLATRRYLFGERVVETDWRLFCTLIRFDAVYHGHFKCNLRRIVDYPNLDGYLRDLYQQPGIAETVNFDHIKRHYYMTHEEINPTHIVPLGPELDFTRVHGREKLSVSALAERKN